MHNAATIAFARLVANLRAAQRTGSAVEAFAGEVDAAGETRWQALCGSAAVILPRKVTVVMWRRDLVYGLYVFIIFLKITRPQWSPLL